MWKVYSINFSSVNISLYEHPSSSTKLKLNSSHVKIKYEFSKPFTCDCGYVQQNMIILDILTRPFSEKYKSLKNINDKDCFYRTQCISKIQNIM